MRRFAAGEMHVLVSTTVVEVGVDVPNATVMVVEHAERFGLAQLHQLRGRIGRGAHASTCVLLYDDAVERRGEGAAVGDGRIRGRLPARRSATWRCAAPATCSARGSRACRCCAPAIRCATPTCSSRPTPRPAPLVEAGAVPAALARARGPRLAASSSAWSWSGRRG